MSQPEFYTPERPEARLEVFDTGSAKDAYLQEQFRGDSGRLLILYPRGTSRTNLQVLARRNGVVAEGVDQIPADGQRGRVSIASYMTINRVLRGAHAAEQIDPAAYDHVIMEEPQQCAVEKFTHIREYFEDRPASALVVAPSAATRMYLGQFFAGSRMDQTGSSPYDWSDRELQHKLRLMSPMLWGGNPVKEGWENKAACAVSKADYYFDTSRDIRLGELACAECPVADECLSEGLRFEAANGYGHEGIYGGLNGYARRRVIRLLKESKFAEATMLIETSRAKLKP